MKNNYRDMLSYEIFHKPLRYSDLRIMKLDDIGKWILWKSVFGSDVYIG